MKSYRFLAPIALIAVAIWAPLAAEQSMNVSPAATLQIGIVATPGDYDGAGCRFQLRSDFEKLNERYVFVANAEEQGILNIDGADVWLPRVGFDAGNGVGFSRFVDYYRKDGLEVRVDLVVTKKCEPSDENCEMTLYDSVLSVKRGAARRMLRTRAFCGM
jgi:hypothetical protein